MSRTSVPHRALLVIDVQNEYVDGGLPIEYPPVDVSLANIGRALDAASRAEIPIVVIQNDAPVGSPLFAVGSYGWQLHPVVAGREGAFLINKTLPSAFAQTELAAWLASRQVDTLTVIGYMTHNCDASTILQAAHLGFTVEFLHDASGSLSYRNEAGQASAEEIHRAFSVVFHSRFAAAVSTDTWIAAVETGQALKRSTIVDSHQPAVTA